MSADERISVPEWEAHAYLEESRRQLERIKALQTRLASDAFEARVIGEEHAWRRKHLDR